jgi:diadenosine tetraphosphate (Ap4A) HIT family hydrolase
MAYDPENIFAKILRGEIPCDKVYEDDMVLAFKDIRPQCPVHVLVIPKGPYLDIGDIAANGRHGEMGALMRGVAEVAKITGVDKTGYRVLVNNGPDGGQEVPHLHLHVVGGRRVGLMVTQPD